MPTNYVIDPIGLGNVAAEYDDEGNLIVRYDDGYGLTRKLTLGAILRTTRSWRSAAPAN